MFLFLLCSFHFYLLQSHWTRFTINSFSNTLPPGHRKNLRSSPAKLLFVNTRISSSIMNFIFAILFAFSFTNFSIFANVPDDFDKNLNVQKKDNSSLYRLPKNVAPNFYDILLLTNVTSGNFTYTGRVSIDLIVREKTKSVILHAEKLNITSEKTQFRKFLSNKNYQDIVIKNQEYDEETQFYNVTFSNELSIGNYSLNLYFTGTVVDDLFGFYRSSYKENNKTR